MKDYSYVFNAHPNVIENLYKTYKDNPESVEQGWRAFFSGFDFQSNGDVTTEKATTVTKLEKDRKSTRLNSSHVKISYAVFCLKKKKKIHKNTKQTKMIRAKNNR